jgi:hypothetical protein
VHPAAAALELGVAATRAGRVGGELHRASMTDLVMLGEVRDRDLFLG